MNNALILANGDPPRKNLLEKYLKESNFFICADGGANIAEKFKLIPDFIIGDLDSINSKTVKTLKDVPTQLIKEQNTTDLEKAFIYVIRKGYKKIFVFGATGGRIDHTMGNLSALIKFSRKAEIVFILNDGILLPVISERKLFVKSGTTISLIPLTLCEGIITSGLKWNLKYEALALGTRESISNITISSQVVIKMRRGNLVVFIADFFPSINNHTAVDSKT